MESQTKTTDESNFILLLNTKIIDSWDISPLCQILVLLPFFDVVHISPRNTQSCHPWCGVRTSIHPPDCSYSESGQTAKSDYQFI